MQVKLLFIAALAGLFLFSGCVSPFWNTTSAPSDPAQGVRVEFSAADGTKLVGTYWKNADASKPALILLHQLGSDRHDFDAYAQRAFAQGLSVLSFDLRGHGESGLSKDAYLQFTDADWNKLPDDIESARKFLDIPRVLVMGASVGANAALNFAAAHPTECAGLVLLSPGLNYHGVDVQDSMKSNACPVLIVASSEDTYAAQSSQSIFDAIGVPDKKIYLLENAGHGTSILDSQPNLVDVVFDWLSAHSN